MLEPDGRVVLLEQLRPPAGFRVNAAVATTFTLSLTAALVPPLAFASGGTSTSDPIAALSAVRACADVVDIFCQPGQIAVPAVASDLMAFLEPMVHPVIPPTGYLFHPKLWLLHYLNDDTQEQRFRLLCTSRNLVESDAWDLAVTLEGNLTDRPRPENRALAELIRWLPKNAVSPLPSSRAKRVEQLARAVERMEWQLPEGMTELATHVWGVPGIPATADFSGYSHLIVAPFMDADGLAHVAQSKNVTVVSRPETIDALDAPALTAMTSRDGGVFVLDSAAVLTDPSSPDAASSAALEREGLHAKLVIAERARKAHVFIGSPNATRPAYHGNIEFALELVGPPRVAGVRAVLGEGSPLLPYLQPYAPSEAPAIADDPLHDLKKALRATAAIPVRLHIQGLGDAYRLNLVSDRELRLPEGMLATASLLTRQGVAANLKSGELLRCVFTGVEKADITPFVVVTLTHGGEALSTVVHAPLHGDPPDRLDEVLRRQVDTPEKFVRFLLLLLGFMDGTSAWIGQLEAGSHQADRAGVVSPDSAWSGLLEELVQALATNPESIRRAGELVDSLRRTDGGQSVFPRGFEELWTSILTVRARTAKES